MRIVVLSILISCLAACSTNEYAFQNAVYSKGDYEKGDKLLAKGVNINQALGYTRTTALFNQLSRGDSMEPLDYLIKNGADPAKMEKNDNGQWTALHGLHVAAANGKTDYLSYLYNVTGLTIDHRTKKQDGRLTVYSVLGKGRGYLHFDENWTPILIAAYQGHPETVERLLKLGADINQQVNGETIFSLLEKGVPAKIAKQEDLDRRMQEWKDSFKSDNNESFLTKAIVIGSVVAIAGTSDISSANKIEVLGAVAADVVNDTDGHNTQKVYLKAQQETINSFGNNFSEIENFETKPKSVVTHNKTNVPEMCRASTWGAYRTIYWDGSRLQCANGSSPIFDNLTFWMGQYCDEGQPNRDPNKILRCQGSALEAARSAAKATMPPEAWPKWGLN